MLFWKLVAELSPLAGKRVNDKKKIIWVVEGLGMVL